MWQQYGEWSIIKLEIWMDKIKHYMTKIAKVVEHIIAHVACLSMQQTRYKMCCPLHVGVVLHDADLRERRGIFLFPWAKTMNIHKARDPMTRQNP